MCLIFREGGVESFLLTLCELITRGAQEKPDVVEGIACASAVTGRVLLDATAHLTWGIASLCDDVKGVEHAGSVLELVVNGLLAVPARDPALRFALPRGSLFRARPPFLYAVPGLPGTRSTQAGRRMVLPATGPRCR